VEQNGEEPAGLPGALSLPLIFLPIVRMLWWFLILAFGAGSALWAGLSICFRVRRHIKEAAARQLTESK
jgi:hypothetical protein